MLSARLVQRAVAEVLFKSSGNSVKSRGCRLIWVRHVSSHKLYVESPLSPVQISPLNIPDYVFRDLDKWPEHTALACAMTGRTYSHTELRVLSRKVAAGFLKSGLKKGQVVTLLLPNLPEFIIALLGALQAGLVVSTINPLYSSEEIAYQLSNADAAMVLTYPAKIGDTQDAISKMKGPKPSLVVIHNPTDPIPNGTRSFMELLMVQQEDEAAVNKVTIDQKDLALLLYSSGTTGLPKGVRLTHRNVVANMCQISCPEIKVDRETTKDTQDSTACVLPFFHVYGLTVGALPHLSVGCKLVTLPKFDPEMYLKAIFEHKISVAHVVPPLVQFLANHPSIKSEHLVSLRYIINGAATVSLVDAQKLKEKITDAVIMSGYGLTESSPVITSSTIKTNNLQTVGHVLSGSQVKIVDTETKEVIDPSKPGEICCRGPQVMEGYHKNEKATKETLIDGWLHTGDVGYFDKEGQLYIVDRIKELIKVKGFQVAPLELEEILKNHEAVVDVAVVGKKDDRSGEVPVAFVVKNPQKSVSEGELLNFVKPKVAEYKQISSIVFVESIPKNSTGKIMRRQLRDSINQ